MFRQIAKHLTAAAIGVALLDGPAQAQTNCAKRDALIEGLATKYGELRVAGGLQSATEMVEVFTSTATGSFTILLTRPNGLSCIVSTGKGWNAIEPTEGPAGSKV